MYITTESITTTINILNHIAKLNTAVNCTSDTVNMLLWAGRSLRPAPCNHITSRTTSHRASQSGAASVLPLQVDRIKLLSIIPKQDSCMHGGGHCLEVMWPQPGCSPPGNHKPAHSQPAVTQSKSTTTILCPAIEHQPHQRQSLIAARHVTHHVKGCRN